MRISKTVNETWKCACKNSIDSDAMRALNGEKMCEDILEVDFDESENF